MKKNTSTLKKIFGYIGHYKYLLFLSVLLAGGSVVLTLYVPIRIGYAIDAIIGAGRLYRRCPTSDHCGGDAAMRWPHAMGDEYTQQ